MKIKEIYKEKLIKEIEKVNPNFYLFKKDVEYWESYDWTLWSEIVNVFTKLLRKGA